LAELIDLLLYAVAGALAVKLISSEYSVARGTIKPLPGY
jgi:hypothetical protein